MSLEFSVGKMDMVTLLHDATLKPVFRERS